MKITIKMSLFVILLSIVSCSDDPVKQVLRMADNNRIELQKVLDHYQHLGDNEKYKAARYLIGNIPGHFSYDTSDLYIYRPVIDKISSLRAKGISDAGIISKLVNPLMDSLIRVHPLSNVYSNTKNDVTSIKSELLIKTIEQAFDSYRHNPFKDSIQFDDFLEYVLPYRVQNGYGLEDWRSYFNQNYSFKTWQDLSSVHMFCDSLLYDFKDLKLGVYVASEFPYIKFRDVLKSKLTNCTQRCWFNCLLLRSSGIPTAIDFVPACRVHELGHEWNVIKLKGGFYPFESFWNDDVRYLKAFYGREKMDPEIGVLQFPKIYRKTFIMNTSELLNHAIHSNDKIPQFFQNPFLKDVTNEYFRTFTIESPIVRNIKSVIYAYACVMGSNQVWEPIDFGKIKKGKISFHSMGSENVYLPSFYESGNMIPAAYPILLKDNGSTSILSPDTVHTRHIEISYVGYLQPRIQKYKKAFIGATIEGSNEKDFEVSEILYQINELCEPGTYHIPINSRNNYRYFRFSIPTNKTELNEIKFFTKKKGIENEIKGELICSDPKNNLLFQKLIDGDLIKKINFNSLGGMHKGLNKIWIGYDFKVPTSISGFKFYFTTNINIRSEGIYELLYWDFGWKSLGIKKPDLLNSISFDRVPENSLLMIKIHDTDKYSRPFTYSGEEQHWW